MSPVSRFVDMNDQPCVQIFFNGKPLALPQGANLAAALLSAGVDVFRHTSVSGDPRGPFCMMGACFDCLVEIDGVVRQACMIEVVEGLAVTSPHEAELNNDQV